LWRVAGQARGLSYGPTGDSLEADSIAEQPNGEGVVVVDPRTKREYRLVPEELFRRVRSRLLDSSEWTIQEMALLAGQAFARLDDTDHSNHLLK
jgi:hypothetical protein